MKDLFLQFAKYNKNVNAVMIKLFDDSGNYLWNKQSGSHYKSIYGIVAHVIESDIRWLKRFNDLSSAEIKAYENIFVNMDNIHQIRKELDDLIIRFIERYEDFNEILDLQQWGINEKLEKWRWVLTWFNHHTHHRGRISTLLDISNIKNDYSVMIGKF